MDMNHTIIINCGLKKVFALVLYKHKHHLQLVMFVFVFYLEGEIWFGVLRIENLLAGIKELYRSFNFNFFTGHLLIQMSSFAILISAPNDTVYFRKFHSTFISRIMFMKYLCSTEKLI